jgi:hypothetical protein
MSSQPNPVQSVALETGAVEPTKLQTEPVVFESGPAESGILEPDVSETLVSQRSLEDANLEPMTSELGMSELAVSAPETVQPDDLERVELSGATKRFLEPLVGFDPSDVPVLSGDAAQRITQSERADALAVDGSIVLRDATNLETPEQLGLLAHELIHVPQQRRFVAPIPSKPAPILEDQPAWTDEESRARLAESRTQRLARSAPTSAQPIGTTSSDGENRWNGLPAPWEPMPSLNFGEDAPSSDAKGNVISLVGSGLSTTAWGDSASSTPPGTTTVAPVSTSSTSSGARLADEARELPSEGGEAGGGDQNIDQLARQVYDVLKRRLQHERRRGGL